MFSVKPIFREIETIRQFEKYEQHILQIIVWLKIDNENKKKESFCLPTIDVIKSAFRNIISLKRPLNVVHGVLIYTKTRLKRVFLK